MGDLELARRAVACVRWRPMRGMRGTDGAIIVLWERGAVAGAASKMDAIGLFREIPVYAGWLPDLTDPATLGCIEALVREAWGEDARLSAECQADEHDIVGWLVFSRSLHALWCDHDREYPRGATRAEALIAALEAAQTKGD